MAFVAILYLHKTHNALRLGGSLSSFAAILVCLVSESLSDMGKKTTFVVLMAAQITVGQIPIYSSIEFRRIYFEGKHG